MKGSFFLFRRSSLSSWKALECVQPAVLALIFSFNTESNDTQIYLVHRGIPLERAACGLRGEGAVAAKPLRPISKVLVHLPSPAAAAAVVLLDLRRHSHRFGQHSTHKKMLKHRKNCETTLTRQRNA